MADPTYTLEHVFRVWNDNLGSKLTVSDDSDGLGLVELRYYDNGEKLTTRITLEVGMAELVAEAITRYLSERKQLAQKLAERSTQ